MVENGDPIVRRARSIIIILAAIVRANTVRYVCNFCYCYVVRYCLIG